MGLGMFFLYSLAAGFVFNIIYYQDMQPAYIIGAIIGHPIWATLIFGIVFFRNGFNLVVASDIVATGNSVSAYFFG